MKSSHAQGHYTQLTFFFPPDTTKWTFQRISRYAITTILTVMSSFKDDNF